MCGYFRCYRCCTLLLCAPPSRSNYVPYLWSYGDSNPRPLQAMERRSVHHRPPSFTVDTPDLPVRPHESARVHHRSLRTVTSLVTSHLAPPRQRGKFGRTAPALQPSAGARPGLFDPGPEARQILIAAAADAHAWINAEFENYFRPFNPGTRWAIPIPPEMITATEANFEQPDAYPVDVRGVAYHFGFFSSKHLGKGQFYLITIVDGHDEPLDGAARYQLTVPANAPVSQYWSATAYNRATHTLIRDVPRPGRSSQSPGLIVNDDGSTDICFGPVPPADGDSNWFPTDPEGRFEVLFRFYGPAPALYDHTWQLPDIKRLDRR
jgi:hypothetical protein